MVSTKMKRVTALAITSLMMLNLSACSLKKESDIDFIKRIEGMGTEADVIQLKSSTVNVDNCLTDISFSVSENSMNSLLTSFGNSISDDGSGGIEAIESTLSMIGVEGLSIEPKEFKVGLESASLIKDNKAYADIDFKLNDESLMDMSAYYSDDGTVAMKLFGSEWIKEDELASPDELDSLSGVTGMTESIDTLKNDMISLSSQVQEMYLGYITEENISDVIRDKKHTVTVGSMEQKMSEYTITLNAEQSSAIITKMFEDYASAVDKFTAKTNPEASFSDLKSEIDDMKSTCIESNPEIKIHTYVSDDKVYGRDYNLKFTDTDDTMKEANFGYIIAFDADNAAAHIEFNVGDEVKINSDFQGVIADNILNGTANTTLFVKGDSIENNEDVVDANTADIVPTEPMSDINETFTTDIKNVDLLALKDGWVKGTVAFPLKNLSDAPEFEDLKKTLTDAGLNIENMSIFVSVDYTADKAYSSFGILDGENEMFNLSCEYRNGTLTDDVLTVTDAKPMSEVDVSSIITEEVVDARIALIIKSVGINGDDTAIKNLTNTIKLLIMSQGSFDYSDYSDMDYYNYDTDTYDSTNSSDDSDNNDLSEYDSLFNETDPDFWE